MNIIMIELERQRLGRRMRAVQCVEQFHGACLDEQGVSRGEIVCHFGLRTR